MSRIVTCEWYRHGDEVHCEVGIHSLRLVVSPSVTRDGCFSWAVRVGEAEDVKMGWSAETGAEAMRLALVDAREWVQEMQGALSGMDGRNPAWAKGES